MCGSGGVIRRVLLLLHGCGSSVGGWLAWADSLAWRRAVTARVCTHGTLGGISIFIAVAAGVAVTVFVASLAAAGLRADSPAWGGAVTAPAFARVRAHGIVTCIAVTVTVVTAVVAVAIVAASLAAAGFALGGVSLAVGTHVVGRAVLTVRAPVAVPTNL